MASPEYHTLSDVVSDLTKEFQRWDHLMENGGSDPFHADGEGLNLCRNHIISHKLQIEAILKNEQEQSFFSSLYPDIYYRATPDEVPNDFMAKDEEIRSRAKEMLTKYEQDPNYRYICDHFDEVFQAGETKATKAAGIVPGKFSRFLGMKNLIDNDKLVEMRSKFYVSYEDNKTLLAECANEMRRFLEQDHVLKDPAPLRDTFPKRKNADTKDSFKEAGPTQRASAEPSRRTSLDERIRSAESRVSSKPEQKDRKEEQMSLF